MSQGEAGTPAPMERIRRTVTPPFRGHPDSEMNAIGISLFLGVVVILIPLLPFIAIVWLISRVTRAVAQKAPVGEE